MRSLYQCSNAKAGLVWLYCRMGHRFKGLTFISNVRLEEGDPLEYKVCQKCEDFDYMGEPIPKSERGWK